MKKLFTLSGSLHTLFGNIAKRLGSPKRPKHALDSRRADSTPLIDNSYIPIIILEIVVSLNRRFARFFSVAVFRACPDHEYFSPTSFVIISLITFLIYSPSVAPPMCLIFWTYNKFRFFSGAALRVTIGSNNFYQDKGRWRKIHHIIIPE